MRTTKTPYFFHDKPTFGLDIGPSSLKVMQIAYPDDSKPGDKALPIISGYGFAPFAREAIEDGVVVQPALVADAARKLFEHNLIGEITTRRVALAIPAYRAFSRSLQLPKLKRSELADAMQLEAEQYISAPLNELYLDYEVIKQDDNGTELFVVAVPQTIVNSYLELAEIMGLEPVLIEPTLSASGRLFALDPQSDVASVIIDFGSRSADISIYDRHILATGTVPAGGEIFTNTIKTALNVTQEEAQLIKIKYGLSASKRQEDIRHALEPILDQLIKEVRRMTRYYEERYGTERPISQIITLGGGANMPGLSDYLTDVIRLAVRHTDPWQYFNFKGLQPPSAADKPMYATAAGLSLIRPKEIFA